MINYGKTTQPISIEQVEKKYGAKYIGDFCLRNSDGAWADEPCAIFYQPTPNVSLGHTHYFGLFERNDTLYITKGDSAFSEPITGIVGSDGEVLYSRFRHDFRTLRSDSSTFIDGGRDYVRRGGNLSTPVVSLLIDKDKLVVADPGVVSDE